MLGMSTFLQIVQLDDTPQQTSSFYKFVDKSI